MKEVLYSSVYKNTTDQIILVAQDSSFHCAMMEELGQLPLTLSSMIFHFNETSHHVFL